MKELLPTTLPKVIPKNPEHRTLAESWKDKFPLYDAYMARFDFIKTKLPADLANSEGMQWLRVGAKIEAALTEFSTGFKDLFWDAITLPINATEPKLRHPNFKKALLAAKSADVVGETRNLQGKAEYVSMWITRGGLSRLGKDRTRAHQQTSRSSGSSDMSTSSNIGGSSMGVGIA